MDYDAYKGLARTTASNKEIHDKAFEIGSNSQGITSMFQKLLDKKTNGKGMKSEIKPDLQLTDELQKLIIRKNQ